jgi:peroxidase
MQSGGPSYKVPLGRRDSASFATRQDVLSDLPPPTATVPALLAVLSKINLDTTDLVALSGGHTIGLGHCTSFEDRLFPRPDPTLNATFAGQLRRTCPAKGTDRRTPLDVRTPNAFDNKYYVNLVNREGLFTSDQDLFTNPGTRALVEKFARNQRDFFDQFAFSVVKMGQIKVLTGAQGQIRRNCSARNVSGRRHAAVVHRRGGREPRVLGVAAASGCRGLVWIGLAISPAADSFLVGSN